MQLNKIKLGSYRAKPASKSRDRVAEGEKRLFDKLKSLDTSVEWEAGDIDWFRDEKNVGVKNS